MNNYRNNTYNHRGGYNGLGQYNNSRGGRRHSRCFTCFKNDHLSPEYPYKDQIDLNFCTKCEVNGQSLEDFPSCLKI